MPTYGLSSLPALNPFTTGFRMVGSPPRALDANLGPWEATDGTTQGGRSLVNSIIGPGLRYVGQQVVIIANTTPGVPGGVTQAYVYWYRGGTGNNDLVEFASGSATGSEFVTGISAAGATFTGLVNALRGISTSHLWVANGATFAGLINGLGGLSLNGNATFGGSVTANSFSGPLTGAVTGNASTATTLQTSRSINGTAFNGSADITTANWGTTRDIQIGSTIRSVNGSGNYSWSLADIGAVGSGSANTFSGLQTFSAGISAAGATFTALAAAYAGISVNGSATFGGSVTASTFTGNLTGNVTGTVSGNAGSATTLQNNRGFSLSGDVTAPQVSFNGSANVTLVTTIADGAVTNQKIATNAAIPDSKLATISTSGKVDNSATTATNANNPSTIVLRDGSGNFSAGTITAALVGNVTGIASNALNLNGVSGASYARLDQNNTFGASLNTFNNDVTIGKTLTVNGNFYVQGTVTTVNRTTLDVDDIQIRLGITTGSMTDALANDGGIVLKGTTDKKFTWIDNTDAWTSTEDLNLVSGKAYEINGGIVLASTYLGSGVIGSSLASVGTVTNGTWNATAIGLAYGGAGANISALPTNGVIYKTATGLTATALGSDGQVLFAGAAGLPAFASPAGLTVGTANKVKVQNKNTTAGTMYLTFVADASNAEELWIDKASGITFDANTNLLSCTQIEATIDGGVWS